MTVQRRRCASCGRIVYEHGQARVIEAARTDAGREPAEDFLSGLETSKKKDKNRLADIAMLLEEYAREGDLERPREINHLRDELWEIKPGDTRLPYYLIEDSFHSVPVARLTSGFLKTQQLTQRHHINWGLRVAREDREQVAREERRQIEGKDEEITGNGEERALEEDAGH